MNAPPVDPARAVAGHSRAGVPRALPTVDPASPVGRMVTDALGRMRFAHPDPAVRALAAEALDGRRSLRDVLGAPDLRPDLAEAARTFGNYMDSLTPDERSELLRPPADLGDRPGPGGPGAY